MKVGVFAVMFSAMKFNDALDYINRLALKRLRLAVAAMWVTPIVSPTNCSTTKLPRPHSNRLLSSAA